MKRVPKDVIAADEEIKTYSEALEKAVFPKCRTKRNVFVFFNDATWAADREDIKCYTIKCQGTSLVLDISYYSDNFKTPPKILFGNNELVQAECFILADYEGEESPLK